MKMRFGLGVLVYLAPNLRTRLRRHLMLFHGY